MTINTQSADNSYWLKYYIVVDCRCLSDLVVISGCGRDSDAVVVDFDKTIAVERPESFFSETIYTYSHDNSILAVNRALVDGAAVDGLIWEYYHRQTHTSFVISQEINTLSVPADNSTYGFCTLVTLLFH